MILTRPDIKEMYIRQMQSDNDSFAESPIIPALQADDDRGHIVFEMGHIGYEYRKMPSITRRRRNDSFCIIPAVHLRRCWTGRGTPDWRSFPSVRDIQSVPV